MNKDCKKITKEEWILFTLLLITLPIGLIGILVISISYVVLKSKSILMRWMLVVVAVVAACGVPSVSAHDTSQMFKHEHKIVQKFVVSERCNKVANQLRRQQNYISANAIHSNDTPITLFCLVNAVKNPQSIYYRYVYNPPIRISIEINKADRTWEAIQL